MEIMRNYVISNEAIGYEKELDRSLKRCISQIGNVELFGCTKAY